MGLLTGRKINNRGQTASEKRAYKRKWWRKHSAEMRKHQSTKTHVSPKKHDHVADALDDFREACEQQKWEDAPMSLWLKIREENPSEMVAWLDRNQDFQPPYGIYLGKPGTEAWRPDIDCAKCGQRHKYGWKHPEEQ